MISYEDRKLLTGAARYGRPGVPSGSLGSKGGHAQPKLPANRDFAISHPESNPSNLVGP